MRQGGNIGAHFDLQKTTDRETAAATLEMIEYFLWYIYVLPESIKELDQKIENLGKQRIDEDGTAESSDG